MSRKFIGLVAAFSIAVTGFSASSARAASEEDIARALAGLVLLGTVVAIVKDKDDRKKKKVEAHATPRRDSYRAPERRDRRELNRDQRRDAYRDRRDDRRAEDWRDRRHRDARLLPAQCLRATDVRGDRMRYFSARCLNREYRFAHRLPEFCQTRVRANGRVSRGYAASCLRNEGYRIARR